jgi:hypothetical protein
LPIKGIRTEEQPFHDPVLKQDHQVLSKTFLIEVLSCLRAKTLPKYTREIRVLAKLDMSVVKVHPPV